MAPSGLTRRMRPSDIRYTQKSIGSRFTDGTLLTETFEQLLNGRISVDQLDSIEVVEERSLYWALTGNRRLYLYRKLEELGELNTIPVRESWILDYGVRRRFDYRKTTTCDGMRIEMRQPEAEWHFRSAIERWKASKMTDLYRNEGLATYTSRHRPTDVPSYRSASTDRNDSHQFFAQGRYEARPSERQLVDSIDAELRQLRVIGLLAIFVLLVIYMYMYLTSK